MFYETLLEQKPESEMALIWCLEHGILSLEKVEQFFGGNTNSKKKLKTSDFITKIKNELNNKTSSST